MIAPKKKIQLVARVSSSNTNTVNLTKPQIIISRVNSFGIDSSHQTFDSHLSMVDPDESSDYESVMSSTDGQVRKRKRLDNLSHEEKIMRR